ncbi:hypothetical protein [Oceanispirochaeta sp.]|jgi:hypothetical protein|uniref:hypothetical protein n=1 Tax=Oceanispirochaeta sp. TaxID=2035350 RepID=UPI002615D670|nr:hypothetical protein [Oceanispirochaeta sp.]MDA3959125.1 hypothetical protein [Oceanispirochaeta sp.]
MQYFWRIQQSLHIGVWIILIYRGMEMQIQEGWYGLLIFSSFQILQYAFFASTIGKTKNYSQGQILVMTLLFGYSWWYPVSKDRSTS